MKSFRSILVLLSALPLVFVVGCQGAARPVESCDECNDNAKWGSKEYCVYGEPDQLYCANPCLSNDSCDPGYWCVPLWDEGTPWTTDNEDIRWVCMHDYYYTSQRRVLYWGDTPCDNACPGEMECLTDDSGMTDMYFCSDSCTNDTNCIGGCCYDTGNGSYCAPRDPYCLGLKRVWYWGETSCVTGGGNECPGGMECLVDDSGQPNMYFCSDPCTTDASCVNGCCYDTGVESFCAPRDPYCL